MYKKVVLLLFVWICYISATAIPKPKEKSSNRGSGGQQAQSDQRGTKNLPVEVNTHAVQSDKEAADETAKNTEQKSINHWNIGLTLAIAICALAQCVAAFLQFWVYNKQKTIMADTLAAIGTQGKDARDSSAASAVTTNETLLAIKRQADATEKQHKAMRDRERARLSLIFPPEDPKLSNLSKMRMEEEVESDVKMILHVENIGISKAFGVKATGNFHFQVKDSPFASEAFLSQIAIPFVINESTAHPIPMEMSWYVPLA